MTTARSQLVPPEAGGFYHCIQRCVRRAFLCGDDHYSGRSFEHRKAWISERLHFLGDCFAVAIHAYAVMSNHVHLVLQIAPETASTWSNEEVAERWVRLFPSADEDGTTTELKRQQLLANPARIDLIRSRLGNLSWFMRCFAEPLARRANREDSCKGRFWEGRYKCQLLCDERALLAAMAYVDLNPIRVGTTERIDEPTTTSASERIATCRTSPDMLTAPLRAIIGLAHLPAPSLSTSDYLQILDWTGRTLAPGKRGAIPVKAPAVLSIIDRSPQRWALRVSGYRSGWVRVAGSVIDLTTLAGRIGQRWLKGVRLALKLA